MPRPDPLQPFPFWLDDRYRPIPTQTWYNGELATYLTEVEKNAFLLDTDIDPFAPL